MFTKAALNAALVSTSYGYRTADERYRITGPSGGWWTLHHIENGAETEYKTLRDVKAHIAEIYNKGIAGDTRTTAELEVEVRRLMRIYDAATNRAARIKAIDQVAAIAKTLAARAREV